MSAEEGYRHFGNSGCIWNTCKLYSDTSVNTSGL